MHWLRWERVWIWPSESLQIVLPLSARQRANALSPSHRGLRPVSICLPSYRRILLHQVPRGKRSWEIHMLKWTVWATHEGMCQDEFSEGEQWSLLVCSIFDDVNVPSPLLLWSADKPKSVIFNWLFESSSKFSGCIWRRTSVGICLGNGIIHSLHTPFTYFEISMADSLLVTALDTLN